MSWVARKLAMADDVDQQQVIQEYFDNKEQARALQDKLLAEFWAEYQEERHDG